MKLFRCGHCGQTFHALRAACSVCRIDPAQNPRFAGIVVQLVTLHFDPPTHVRGIGHGHIACDPTQRVGPHRATGEPSVVNCPACRATPEWRAAYQGEAGLVSDEDEAVLPGDYLGDDEDDAQGGAVVAGPVAPAGGGGIAISSKHG